jgi:hypothetical protein
LKNEQGDQIGRIFAQWAIVYFWQFINITEVGSPKEWPIFSIEYALILTKHWLGYVLAIFSQTHLVTLRMRHMGI